MSKLIALLDKILTGVEMGATVLSSIPSPVSGLATLADYFLRIAQAAVKAHEAITGQPLDLTKLHDLDPLP